MNGHITPAAEARNLLIDERERQIKVEGYNHAHDDAHRDGQLAEAAACYALVGAGRDEENVVARHWPTNWDTDHFKVGDGRKRCLTKAGALILAELERLIREERKS